jgi:predicted nuclease of predicted toxin-antitoxin system
MKLLFDQNISQRILKVLPEIFIGSSHIKMEGLLNSSDRYILEFAKKNGFIIVSQDSDFNELNSLLGFPPKIIWIRTGNIKTETLIKILTDNYLDILKFIEDENYGCYEIMRIKK